MGRKTISVFLAGAAVVGMGAVAWANTSPNRPTLAAQAESPAQPPGEPGTRPRPHPGPAAGLMHRAVHGELLVRTGETTFETVVFDKGQVTEVDDGTISLKRPDGVSVTLKLDDQTKYRGIAGQDEVRTGEPAIVVSKDGTARLVAQRPEGEEGRVGPPPGRPGAARFAPGGAPAGAAAGAVDPFAELGNIAGLGGV